MVLLALQDLKFFGQCLFLEPNYARSERRKYSDDLG